jgi:hypothetical protein
MPVSALPSYRDVRDYGRRLAEEERRRLDSTLAFLQEPMMMGGFEQQRQLGMGDLRLLESQAPEYRYTPSSVYERNIGATPWESMRNAVRRSGVRRDAARQQAPMQGPSGAADMLRLFGARDEEFALGAPEMEAMQLPEAGAFPGDASVSAAASQPAIVAPDNPDRMEALQEAVIEPPAMPVDGAAPTASPMSGQGLTFAEESAIDFDSYSPTVVGPVPGFGEEIVTFTNVPATRDEVLRRGGQVEFLDPDEPDYLARTMDKFERGGVVPTDLAFDRRSEMVGAKGTSRAALDSERAIKAAPYEAAAEVDKQVAAAKSRAEAVKAVKEGDTSILSRFNRERGTSAEIANRAQTIADTILSGRFASVAEIPDGDLEAFVDGFLPPYQGDDANPDIKAETRAVFNHLARYANPQVGALAPLDDATAKETMMRLYDTILRRRASRLPARQIVEDPMAKYTPTPAEK